MTHIFINENSIVATHLPREGSLSLGVLTSPLKSIEITKEIQINTPSAEHLRYAVNGQYRWFPATAITGNYGKLHLGITTRPHTTLTTHNIEGLNYGSYPFN